MRKRYGLALLPLMTACADYGPSQVAPPNAISVQDAFRDVGLGLQTFRGIVDPYVNGQYQSTLGLITCRVYVRFNIAATAGQKGGVTATLAAPIQAVKASVSGSYDEEATAQRGNVVIVDMASINPQICAWYEKQTDVVNGGSASADTKGGTQTTKTSTSAVRKKKGGAAGAEGAGGGSDSDGASNETVTMPAPIAPPTPPPLSPGITPFSFHHDFNSPPPEPAQIPSGQ